MSSQTTRAWKITAGVFSDAIVALPPAGLQVLVEPADDTPLDVADVLALRDAVPFVLVDDELRRHAQRPQRVPELVALRRRDLGIPVAVQDERRRLRFLDEGDRRGSGVDLGIFVDGGSEEGDHPAVDAVLPVVALPVDDPRARDGGLEAVGARDRPHRHVSAVAPSRDTDPLRVDRGRGSHRLVHALQDVVEVPVPELLDVAPGEGVALPVAAARVGKEEEVVLRREDRVPSDRPTGAADAGGPAVDADNHGIAPARLDGPRRDEPALHGRSAALPVEAAGRAPEGNVPLVLPGQLFPAAGQARVDL